MVSASCRSTSAPTSRENRTCSVASRWGRTRRLGRLTEAPRHAACPHCGDESLEMRLACRGGVERSEETCSTEQQWTGLTVASLHQGDSTAEMLGLRGAQRVGWTCLDS